MKRIFCRTESCLACRSCELACAVEHSQSKNLVDAVHETILPKHRINVVLIGEKGSAGRMRSIAMQCRHCDDPMCIQACKPGCIYRDEKSGDVLIDHERCVACWACIKVCPFKAIVKHEDLHRAVKCDHCPGRQIPACVEACPTGALFQGVQDESGIDYDELL